MNLPSGLVFYLDFKYGKNVSGYGDGTSIDVPGGDAESLGGKTGPNSPIGSSAPYGEGGLYGEGRYDYSINQSSTAVILASGGSATPAAGTFTQTSANYKDINFNQEFSSSLGAFDKLTFRASDFSNADLKAVRSFNLSQSITDGVQAALTANTAKLLPQFTKVTTVSGVDYIQVIVSASAAVTYNDAATSATNFSSASINFTTQPEEHSRGDFEDTVGNATLDSLAIPEVDLQLKSQAIVAKTRKLKAVWTPELAQDLNAYHSVDAEAELTSMLSEYISMEIDLEILDMLISDAQTTAYWSATPGEDYNGTGTDEGGWDITTFSLLYLMKSTN
jgi:hypothetical protein